jgi:L-ascorbate metabolism protein UlaG (beta-lactamase superfamily)
MPLSKRTQIIAASIFIITLVTLSAVFVFSSLLNPNPVNRNGVYIQLLDNAGVMIEAEGQRIFIDPYNLPPNYQFYPADAILITHPHYDHYQLEAVNMLQKSGTMNVFPATMTTEIELHSGLGVNPEDQFQVGSIDVTAFYLYTSSNHPRSANWTSYIIDINGFTIFHGGDSETIEEYAELQGSIDVAILPYYILIEAEDIVEAVQVIEPDYLIIMHWTQFRKDAFIDTYGPAIGECEILDLDYFESYFFNPA